MLRSRSSTDSPDSVTHRRSFNLLIVFNFLLTVLLWLIVAQDHGFIDTLKSVEPLFRIRTSLFDLVVVGFVRALTLLISYAIVVTKSRYPVWVTTLCNTVYLIIKVFFYKFSSSKLTDIILGVACFIMAWVECIFFEAKVSRRSRPADQVTTAPTSDESTPLFSPTQRSLNGQTIYGIPISGDRYSAPPSETASMFRTPHGSPTPSDLGHHVCELGTSRRSIPEEEETEDDDNILSPEQQRLVNTGQQVLDIVWQLYNLPSSEWTEEKTTSNIEIHSYVDRAGVKTFRGQAIINSNASQVFRVAFFDQDRIPEWDITVRESRILEVIDDYTRIGYNVAADMGGGVISQRDFVSVSRWAKFDDTWASAGCACTHSSMPPVPGKVRGENGPCGFICRPLPNDPSKCHFTWLLNTDLKGWIPKSIIERALAGVLVSFIERLQQRLLDLRS